MLHPEGAKSYMLALPRSGNMHEVGSINGQSASALWSPDPSNSRLG